jgi:hypothetical protein
MTSDTPDMDDDTKLMLARAFDSAWERFIEREGADADTDDNRKRLARRIVAEAKAGDIDEEQLSESGLIYLCVLAEAARLGNERQADLPDDNAGETPNSGTRAFGPDAIGAMSTALERCLEELPLRLPSEVVAFLTRAILDEATRGERDPARLSEIALQALKSR